MIKIALTRIACLLPLIVPSGDLEDFAADYERAKQAERKIAVLENVAALGQASLDASDENGAAAATEFLSQAMWSDLHRVRMRAVQLLAEGQVHSVAAANLLKRCQEYQQDFKVLDQQSQTNGTQKLLAVAKLNQAMQELADPKKRAKAEKESRATREALEELDRIDAEIETKLGELDDFKFALTHTLRGIIDDRAVTALGLLMGNQRGFPEEAVLEALLQHGTVPAAQLVLDCVPPLEQRLQKINKRVRDARRWRPGRPPAGTGDKEAWKKREEARQEKSVEKQKRLLSLYEEWEGILLGQFKTFAKASRPSGSPAQVDSRQEVAQVVRTRQSPLAGIGS